MFKKVNLFAKQKWTISQKYLNVRKRVWNQYDQSGTDSDKVARLFLDNDPSKLSPYLFKPLISLSDEVEENQACNISGNQAPRSS